MHSFYSSRQPSGENVVVDAQVASLREEGIDVQLVAARTDELETKTLYKPRTAMNVATGLGASPLAQLKDFEPDIVHVHNLFPNWGTSWLEHWKGPLVATAHNFRPVCAAGTLFRDGKVCTLCPDTSVLAGIKHSCYRDSKIATAPLAIRSRKGVRGDRLLSRADRVILLSKRAESLYVGFGLDPERTSVIPNFVEDIGFTPDTPPGGAWVYIGRLTEEKGIANLVKHWPDDETLVVHGDGPLRAQIESEALVRPNVHYVGQLGHAGVPGALAAAKGLVFPSEWAEGLPLVYAEALASGRAVVAKAGNSAADDVAVSGTGVVFDSWNDLGWALSRASSELLQLGAGARKRYMSAYTRSTWVEATLAAYALAGDGAGGRRGWKT